MTRFLDLYVYKMLHNLLFSTRTEAGAVAIFVDINTLASRELTHGALTRVHWIPNFICSPLLFLFLYPLALSKHLDLLKKMNGGCN